MAEIHPIRRDQVSELASLIKEFSVFEKLDHICKADERSLVDVLFGESAFAHCLVAEDDGKCVGYALFYPVFRTFSSVPAMYLEDLYVKPEMRGAGLGIRLLAHVAKAAEARGIRRIDFQALSWNIDAIGFYEALGAVRDEGNIDFRISGDAFLNLSSK